MCEKIDHAEFDRILIEEFAAAQQRHGNNAGRVVLVVDLPNGAVCHGPADEAEKIVRERMDDDK